MRAERNVASFPPAASTQGRRQEFLFSGPQIQRGLGGGGTPITLTKSLDLRSYHKCHTLSLGGPDPRPPRPPPPPLSVAHIVHDTVRQFVVWSPMPSSVQHLSSDDCLEDKREDYQNRSVLYCVRQLCPMICQHVSGSYS